MGFLKFILVVFGGGLILFSLTYETRMFESEEQKKRQNKNVKRTTKIFERLSKNIERGLWQYSECVKRHTRAPHFAAYAHSLLLSQYPHSKR